MIQLGNRELQAVVRVRIGGKIGAAGTRMISEPPDRGEDVVRVDRRLLPALDDRLFDHLHRVLGQQLQDPHVLPGSGRQALALLKVRP